MYSNIYIYIYVYIHIYIRIYIYICMYEYAHVHIYICVHVCIYIRMCTCMYISIFVYLVTVCLLFLLVLWLRGGVWPDPLKRAERATASAASQRGGASESSRMRAGVYLKLGISQTQQAHMTQTKNWTYHRQKLYVRGTTMPALGTASGGDEGGQGQGLAQG